MKRKGLLFVALTMLLCVLNLCFVACNENPHIHDYVDIVTQPTYTERGYTTHICSCGDKYIDTYIEKLKYKIHLETNGGQCDIDCVEYLLGDRVVLPTPTKGEMFFEGWFVDADCEERFTARYYNNYDTTILYAAYSSYDLSAYEFVEYGNGWDLVAYTGNETKIIAPEIYKNKPIIRIYNTVYAYNTKLIELTIPDSILYLQEGLLSGCTSLKILTISSLPSKLGLLFNKHTFDISVTINDVIASGWNARSYGSYYYSIPYGPWRLKEKWYRYNGIKYLYQGESVQFIERTQRISYNGSYIDSYSAPTAAVFVAYSIPLSLEEIVVTKQDVNNVKTAITNCDWFSVIVGGQTIMKAPSGGSGGY